MYRWEGIQRNIRLVWTWWEREIKVVFGDRTVADHGLKLVSSKRTRVEHINIEVRGEWGNDDGGNSAHALKAWWRECTSYNFLFRKSWGKTEIVSVVCWWCLNFFSWGVSATGYLNYYFEIDILFVFWFMKIINKDRRYCFGILLLSIVSIAY